MLGTGIMLIGVFLAMSASITAFRGAPDRAFAVAAVTIAGAETLVVLLAVVVSLISLI